MMRTVLFAMPLLIAGCAITPAQQQSMDQQAAATQSKLDKVLAGYVRGATTTCLPIVLRSQPSVAYGNTILFGSRSSRFYRSDTAGGCEHAGHDDALITSTPSTHLCRGDIARTVNLVSGTPTGSCSFGSFTQYHRP